MMLLLVLLTVASTAAIGYTVWPAIKSAVKDGGQPSTAAPANVVAARPHVPASLEGALADQLAAAEITRRQYIHAMEGLAARDDERHPLAVPPETGSTA